MTNVAPPAEQLHATALTSVRDFQRDTPRHVVMLRLILAGLEHNLTSAKPHEFVRRAS